MSALVPTGGGAVVGWSAPSPVVLEPAVDAVRLSIVHLYGVKLSDLRAVAFDPVLSAVPTDVDAAVVAVDEVVGVVRVNPQMVVVDVHVGRTD